MAHNMTSAAFAIPGDINLRTGGYIYDRRVLSLLRQFQITAEHLPLPGSYPSPSKGDLESTAQAFAQLPPNTVLLVDGLALGAMPADVISQARCPIVALVHHPLCLETGLSAERQSELKAMEAAALALARQVVVTSATTARTLLSLFAVPAEKITVAEPGTDAADQVRRVRVVPIRPTERDRSTWAAPPATKSPYENALVQPAALPSETLQLLAVGSIVPRKGYDILVRALDRLLHLDWQLIIAGDEGRSPETTRNLRTEIRFSGAYNRIRLVGAVDKDRLADLYAHADLFVTASHYEGYGMVLSEALARGLPIVTTTGGAASETVPDPAALKVPPGDVDALATALGRAIQDGALRKKLADASWAAGQKLPRWEETARIIAAVIAGVAKEGEQ
jgi:glycosyltransferase involved in cell wall biosynthesis